MRDPLPSRSLIVKSRPAATHDFPVVGVGASAGGLDAFRQLLAHVPPRSGMAFVLVQHLEPARASLLSDALSGSTRMRVAQAEDGVRVEPDRVYVIPPGTQMAIEQGILKLSPLQAEERRPHLPIDFFLRSLATDRGRQAIGVVLSGTASDGTAGLAAVRAHGGITFAQDPRSARFGQMPRSAVDAGVVDFCLPLPALGAELVRLASHPYLVAADPAPPAVVGAVSLAQVASLVRGATGVDFGEYRPATFKRRLARRMAVRQVKDVAAYLEILRRDPGEIRSMYDDLLIKMTSFFRDEEIVDELKSVAFPAILKAKGAGAPIRAWVVGCAAGEEVYSLAIALVEHLGDARGGHPILVFGSDLDDKAIGRARAGIYPDAAVQGFGEERLTRFFVRVEGGWRIGAAIRELCVFVRHDVARDPPFSRLDLLSCRNVLTYFGQALQRQVLEMAHHALGQGGYLLLGRSERTSGLSRWFVPASKAGGLFRRRPGPSTFRFPHRTGGLPVLAPAIADGLASPRTDGALARRADEAVLARYGPPGVVLNDRLEVVQFRGRTGAYLEPPDGEPQSQVLKMARSGLAAQLRIALAQVRRTSAPFRRAQVPFDGARDRRVCDLEVLPLTGGAAGEGGFVVLFEERTADPGAQGPAGRKRARPQEKGRRALEEELASTREYVAVLLEEHGRATDALATANDELMAGNEELQSLNEELETAREELQATNEELNTLNDELRGRNQEQQAVNADVVNLLDAVETPIVILDENRRIRRFTSRAAAFLGLSPSHVGRRITEFDLPVVAPDLEQWITRSMGQAILVEGEVQDRSDRWHRLQIRPHRSLDGKVDGAILSLTDVDDLRHQVVSAQWARDYARNIVEAVQVPLVVLDAGFCVLSANAAYYRIFRERPDQTEGQAFFELASGGWNTTELHRAVVAVHGDDGRFQGLRVERDVVGGGRCTTTVSGCSVPSQAGVSLLLLSIEVVS